MLRNHLRQTYDAFLSFDKDEVLGQSFAKLTPREKTLKLIQASDLNLFVFTRTGIRDGLVAELTEIQVRFPQLANYHVALIENRLSLSSILDEAQGGVMAVPPIKQIFFDNESELLDTAAQVAYNFNQAKLQGYQV